MAPALINLPTAMILPAIYVEYTAVTLTTIGLVNLFRWWFDAVSDPAVGYLSDRWVSRGGSRKPWVVGGAMIAAVSAYFLFQPPAEAGALFYAMGLMGVYLGFTCFSISHTSWGSEIAVDYDDRSRISMYFSVFTILGSLAIWLIPLALYPFTGSLAMTPGVMTVLAWVILLVLPGTTLIASLFVPAGTRMSVQNTTLREAAATLRGNRLLHRYIVAVMIWGIGQGINLSLIFIFLRDYLELGDWFPVLMIVYFSVQTVSMPFWKWAMTRWGKHRPWAASWVIGAILTPFILLVEPGALGIVLALISLQAFVTGGSYIGPVAILGDIADYSLLKTGANSTGILFSFKSLLEKANFGVGAAIAFPVLGWFGYEVGGTNDGTANLGLILLFVVVPSFTATLAAAVLWNFPLDERRHGIVRRRIEQRAERTAAAAV